MHWFPSMSMHAASANSGRLKNACSLVVIGLNPMVYGRPLAISRSVSSGKEVLSDDSICQLLPQAIVVTNVESAKSAGT